MTERLGMGLWARTLVSFLAIFSSIVGAVEAQEPSREPAPARSADWLADFAHLRDALTRQYPNLEWAVERRGVRLADLSRNTEAALIAAQSDAAAKGAIVSFLNAFGDGHLEARWPSAGPPVTERHPRSIGVCERLGYERARRGGGIRFELLRGFRWIASPDSAFFPAGVLEAGRDRIGVLRIASFEDKIHPELCEAAMNALGITRDAPCDSVCGDRVVRETADRLTAVLERRIAALQGEGITRLLVDVTGNGGGTNWVEAAARTLTSVPLHGARMGFIRHPHYVRAFEANIQQLTRDSIKSGPEMQARLGDALAVLRRQRQEANLPCNRSGLWRGQVPACSMVVSSPARYSTGVLAYASPQDVDTTAAWRVLFSPARYRYREGAYGGPLIVLIDRGTVSAAEYFAALMMDNSAGLVAGAPTYGAGCGYTNGGIPVVLPNSRGRILIPDCVRYRRSGINEVEGVAPDLLIPWRLNDTPLQRARRVAETLAAAPSL
jgi:hypothetical protein